MSPADKKMLENLRDAAIRVQWNRGDEPVRELGEALEAYAVRCLEDAGDEPEITVETTPAAKPQ